MGVIFLMSSPDKVALVTAPVEEHSRDLRRDLRSRDLDLDIRRRERDIPPRPRREREHRDRSEEYCRDFQRGHCPRGLHCPFVHKDPPDELQRRKEACRDFLRGNCPRGIRCIYSHQVEGKEICRDFNRGNCPRGSECTYSHTLLAPGRDSPPPREPPPEHDDERYNSTLRKRPRYDYESPSSPVCSISSSELEYLLHLKSEVAILREDNRYLRDENRALRRELKEPIIRRRY